jgi:hypothetical protein
MRKIHASARVQITVEVDAGAPWGDECTVGQLYAQAAEAGRNNLLNALKAGAGASMRIVGEPKIIGIITEES